MINHQSTFENEHEILVHQAVHYERRPIEYQHCCMFGYDKEDSRKKEKWKIVWVPIKKLGAH